jgi:hypothetical protein
LNETNENKCLNNDSIEYETLSKTNNTITKQIPIAIRDFSSQYGSNRSDSYVVSNICSNPEIYPLYGDSTHALVFRTYGPWWINMPSYKETIKNFLRWENNFTSRDFIDIEFKDFVSECISLNIYETYNPGTLEVVYVGKEDEYGNNTWHRVWTFPEPFSIILENNEEFFIQNGKTIDLLWKIISNHTDKIVYFIPDQCFIQDFFFREGEKLFGNRKFLKNYFRSSNNE